MKIQKLYESSFKFYTDGVRTIKVKDGDEIPDGFHPGRTFKSNPWNKGLTAETDERVKADGQATRETRLNNNSYVAWNKGLTQETDERVAKNITNMRKGVIRQYFDKERYPFKCDFYIPSEDKFIEIHANWTHGGRPFDSNDEGCLKQLELWEERAKTSDYYKNAIYQWTNLDVRKAQCAKKNNLNFEAIYY